MKISSLFLITLSLCILLPAHTVQATYKQFFQKYFGKACTAIGFGIAAGPCWTGAVLKQVKSNATNDPDYLEASKEVQEFCRKEIQDMGMDASKISVKIPKTPIVTEEVDPKNGHAFGKTLVIDYPDDIEFCIREKEKLQKVDESKLSAEELQKKHTWHKTVTDHTNQWRFIVQHEAMHIKHNDSNNLALAAFSIPLVTHACLSLVKRKIPSTAMQHLKKIPAGFAKMCINGTAFSEYAKFREQKADEGVNNDKDILKGGYTFMMSRHEDLTKGLEATFYDHPDINPKICKGIRTMLYSLADPTHPTPIVRAQKFEQRLKKQESRNTHVHPALTNKNEK